MLSSFAPTFNPLYLRRSAPRSCVHPLVMASTNVLRLSPGEEPLHCEGARVPQSLLYFSATCPAACVTASSSSVETGGIYPAHGVSTLPSSTCCSYVRTYRYEDAPLSKRRGPREEVHCAPVHSTTIEYTTLPERRSEQSSPKALRFFQAPPTTSMKIRYLRENKLFSSQGRHSIQTLPDASSSTSSSAQYVQVPRNAFTQRIVTF